jgi:hypothetical protein
MSLEEVGLEGVHASLPFCRVKAAARLRGALI